jgi:hypothetical protein
MKSVTIISLNDNSIQKQYIDADQSVVAPGNILTTCDNSDLTVQIMGNASSVRLLAEAF